ncbi:SDR family oxidoreductase [Nitratireductor sp. XY-223]|uniref:SDR family NAD(P)-dependent oxidoreductase n=1 Tax=Nitratireductor sp. XY-223 TaxID=2561926 RepID=UPI0010AB1635|nr:SDR family oxidoreductase [Nitratireductor sp. XY-223]
MSQRFENSIVLVTGANDRGFGGAIAEKFAEEGATLVLTDRVAPKRLLGRLERRGAPVRWYEGDITDLGFVRQMVAETASEFGRIDAVVNCAGVSCFGLFEDLTDEQWEFTFDVNVKGTVRVTREALPHMTSPGGVIINVASVLAENACAGNAAYGASKAAVIALTNSLALEVAPKKIRAVCIAPALAHTPMLHDFAKDFTPEAWEQVNACHPLGTGSRHDIANAVAFLASSDAGWITGSTLPLGWTQTIPLPMVSSEKQQS